MTGREFKARKLTEERLNNLGWGISHNASEARALAQQCERQIYDECYQEAFETANELKDRLFLIIAYEGVVGRISAEHFASNSEGV